VLHARPLDTPEAVGALRDHPTYAYHYVVTETGAVIQLVPERGWTHHTDPTIEPRMCDRRTLAIALSGDPRQTQWPPEQVLGVARILSVIRAVRGHLPVRDAASICAPTGRIHPIDAWPWLDMHRLTIRIATPIDRIYDILRDSPDYDPEQFDERL
jgi:N-acetyl-anhydromuramyl-L-alanine amidase AmpD